MPVTKAHIRATTKYENKSYDKICIRIRKDADITRDKLQKAADAAGESLNSYVMEAVRQRMKNTDKEEIKAREIAEEKIFGDFLRWYEEHKKEIEEGKITDYTVK